MSEITLSVIIPVTRMSGKLSNLKKTFEDCLEKDIEFVIVHDEQDEETQNELEELIATFRDLRIMLFRKTFNSPGLARNYGISKSIGLWFCFSDSDDVPYTTNLKTTAINTDKANADVGIGSLIIQFEDRQTLVESNFLKEISRKSLGTFVQNPSFTRFVFKSEKFKSVEFPKSRMAEDQVYLARTNFLDHKIYLSNLILYKYFVDLPNQATKNKKSLKELSDSLPLLYELKNLGSPKTNQLIWMLLLKISLTCLSRRINLRKAFKYVVIAAITNPRDSLSIFLSYGRVKIANR